MHYSESPQPCPQGMPPAFGMVAHKFGVPWKVLVNKA